MTRKEAINKLNWALDNNTIEDVQSAYDYIMAIEMAIKALEQDCISRTDMLDAIGHGTTYTSEDLQRIVEGLPSANREYGVKMSEMPICSRNFIQLKQDVLNNKQLWQKLREIEDE